MARCVPIRELKNTAEFAALVEREPEPVTVTKNGAETLVVMKPSEYDSLRLERARAELYAMVLRDDADIAAGAYEDAGEFLAGLRAKYEI